jgi:glycosyltransferase involved in cell wall biosynthesis
MSVPPTVSVLLPVYNCRRYLDEAVSSILRQTFTDFELIAVDDGSTDDSGDILRRYAIQDTRVKLISRANAGIAVALNDAMAVAKGEFLARRDGDDISLPPRFEMQLRFLREHSDVVLLGSRVRLIDPFGVALYESSHKLTHEEIEREMLDGVGWAVVHPAAMMRAAAVRAAGGYRAERVPTEDLDLFLRMSEIGKVANLPDILLEYRQHHASANHTRVEEQNRNKRAILSEAYARRGLTLPSDWTPPKRDVLAAEKEISMWGWAALKQGNRRAARHHAMSLLRLTPFSIASWRLMFCALRGR